MRAFAKRWLTGDDRTLGLFLGGGVLVMAFFRLDKVRAQLGAAPQAPLVLAAVLAAGAWWSLWSRSFVWLDPADLTWRGDIDRVRLVARRLTGGWVARQLVLGYLFALLAAVAVAPVAVVVSGAAMLTGADARRRPTRSVRPAQRRAAGGGLFGTRSLATAHSTVDPGIAGGAAPRKKIPG